MSDKKKLSLLANLGVKAMRGMAKITQGYDPIFLGEMVNLLGFSGLTEWSEKLQGVADAAEARFGVIDAQVLISFAAMLNGCRVCSVGHMYVANLHYFDETGGLFPIDEREVYDLQALEDEVLFQTLEERLEGERFDNVRRLLDRIYDLKFRGAEVADADDEHLEGLIGVWDLLSECTIVQDITDASQIEPLTTIAKNKDLIRRYQAARGRS